jgi:hypothetical protein
MHCKTLEVPAADSSQSERGAKPSKSANRLTPWGVADQVTIVAPGIVRYHTPSHGGYWLSEERLAQMAPALRTFRPFTGDAAWFEEDCDWAVVVVAFPASFDAAVVDAAMRAIRHSDYYTRAGLDNEHLYASATWEVAARKAGEAGEVSCESNDQAKEGRRGLTMANKLVRGAKSPKGGAT